ncbi:hypothetical protein MKW94_012289 [Papaver nudicaule]|uniref:Serine carboxypeptidase n=1 Tax=Papaver nudicaule TaxID=74823 RepID=A0AA41SJ01_PAPNU|nr:hypothetical protein [Papaver nudicaule]
MTTPPIQMHLIFLLLCVSSLSHSYEAISSGKVVTYLPGVAVNPLPFHLETGYIGVGDGGVNQLFYYFAKSERNPKEDPLVFWLVGGTRCSALNALAAQLGPLSMDCPVEYNNGSIPTVSVNPYSWTKVANIIFLDEPVGTGFSYSKSSHEYKMGDLRSAENSYEFLRKWLIQNAEFQSNPLYISADSYSGQILPIIVQDVIRDVEAGKYSFLNFKGWSLGNAVTNRQLEENAYVPFAYNMGLISYELYQSMMVNCKGNFLGFDLSNPNCSRDRQVFESLIAGILVSDVMEPLCDKDKLFGAPLNPKDMMETRGRRSLAKTGESFVSEKHLVPPSCSQTYSAIYMLQQWASSEEVQKALHVREGTIKKWVRCNGELSYDRDINLNSIGYHQNISTKGYRSLIYSGSSDMEVSHISTEAWIRTLNLSITEDWRPWSFDGQVAGYTRTFSNGLTYATVKASGHIAAVAKPKGSSNSL